ncbi:ABC transporter substrate-binding protein [Pseudodesulfovibrio sp. JC047]|uniref:ABC transporter substrate-binding protein n=1 Tax=Pseudodesulfovibrio sp. JC047 TaxID=2683199 RepID=UPI0013D5EF7D|nr:ABC transporter substrate-binding protein [Pseudodesulfovibrio sp. JC047]NDV19348.1 ABC transporter substrate-binding protein [Pseudodesulfovibrio sp. JC047]
MRKILAIMVFIFAFSGIAQAEPVHIRFGILPVIDTLPLQVGVQDRLFEKHGIDMELIQFASALERDTAMQAGQLDGYFGDLVATYLLINQGVPMRIALTSWRTTPGFPMFGIALSPANKDLDFAAMKGRTLGLSKSSVMEFLADKMEQQLGADSRHFSLLEIKKIPIRLQMLMTNQLDSALLPEPLLSLARLKGGGQLATAEQLNVPLTVLCLHDSYFADNAESYGKFIAAYKEAVQRLHDTPEKYRSLMAQTCRIPKPLMAEFPMYPYPMPSLPSAVELDEVQTWMVAKGLLTSKVPDETALSPILP